MQNNKRSGLFARLFACLAATLPVAGLATTTPEPPAGFAGGHEEALGRLYDRQELPLAPTALEERFRDESAVRHWNQIAVDASGLDHTPVAAGETRVFGEQLGPARASRAMAIVQIAVFEAVNTIAPRYRSYVGMDAGPRGASIDAAVAQSAHDALVVLFPSQKPRFDQQLADCLGRIRPGWQKNEGMQVGRRCAAASLAARVGDGSAHAEPRVGVDFITQSTAGSWRQDPVSRIPLALGARWDEVRPFVMVSADQFRVPPPPAMASAA